MLTATSYGADGATFRQIFRRQGLFWFFQSLMAGYKLPGIVRQRATSLSAVQLVQGLLSVTCSLTRALSQSLTHAQQLFSASTPGQILVPRVCTLMLFIYKVFRITRHSKLPGFTLHDCAYISDYSLGTQFPMLNIHRPQARP